MDIMNEGQKFLIKVRDEECNIRQVLEEYSYYSKLNNKVLGNEIDGIEFPTQLRGITNPIEDHMSELISYLRDKTKEIEEELKINILERYQIGKTVVEKSKEYNYEMSGIIADIIQHNFMVVLDTEELKKEVFSFYEKEKDVEWDKKIIFKTKLPKIEINNIAYLLYSLGLSLWFKEDEN